MTGEGHSLKEVVPGPAEVVQGAVAEIVKDEIFYTSIFEGNFPGPFKFMERLAIEKKDTVRIVNSPKNNSYQVVTKGTE